MYKNSAPKRTGIYRIDGNIANFQLELQLRHISEWLPVPKFEYGGATANGSHGDNYPTESSPGSWSDCFIYVPIDEHTGNSVCNYYNYYNPSIGYLGNGYPGNGYPGNGYPSIDYPNSGYPSGGFPSGGYSLSEYSGSRKYNGSRSESGMSRNSSRTATSSTSQSLSQSQSQSQSLHPEQHAGDAFYTLNKELCNGGTARLCIGWQEKHFSRSELQRYADAKMCITTLQRRYHRRTQDIIRQQQRHEKQLKQHVRRRKSKRKTSSYLTLPLSELSVLSEDPHFAARTCLMHTLVDADLAEQGAQTGTETRLPPEVQQLHDQGYQQMYVYAQLQQDVLLLSLRYSPSEGLLYVYPDFSSSANDMDYVLEIDNDCRQLYAYGFQISNPLKRWRTQLLEEEDTEQQQSVDDLSLPASDVSAQQLLNHHQRQRDKAAELRCLLQFALPPKRMRRVSLLLELREAQDFEYPNIHVRFYINTPRHTILEPARLYDPFPLRGATATCVAAGDWRVARFSHCWQLTLLCEESYTPDELLHIYFEVISVDSWQRERCEGYSHFSCSLLASLPGEASTGIRLQCIRPRGNWLDALNRYFIGGRALFDFVGYFRSRESTLHSRLELDKVHAMRSTGTLLFSMQKLQQQQHRIGDQLSMDDSDYECDDGQSGKATRTTTTLDEVLAAYVEARERIEALLADDALHN